MIAWLLSLLFPLWALLPRARELGAVTFQEVAGVGWQCTIRPPQATGVRRRGSVNSWSAQGRTLGKALKGAMAEAKENPTNGASTAASLPKLGGYSHDPDDAN